MRGWRVLGVGVLLVAGCGGSQKAERIPDLTPRPSSEQAEQLETEISAVYPGVPAGKATDWAVAVCKDKRDGHDQAELLERIQRRYAGGNRPDPTPEQAQAILDAIARAGFCT